MKEKVLEAILVNLSLCTYSKVLFVKFPLPYHPPDPYPISQKPTHVRGNGDPLLHEVWLLAHVRM